MPHSIELSLHIARKPWTYGLLLLVLACGLPMCSSDDDPPPSIVTSSSTGSAQGGSGGNASSTTSGFGGFNQGDCPEGSPCDPDGICLSDGTCCPVALACGDACCANAQVCAFQQCQTPGNECVDAGDCAPTEYCDYSLGTVVSGSGGAGGAVGTGGSGASCQGGVVYQTGKCLPKPPICGPNANPGDPPSCVQECEYHPPPGQFNPELKYSWGNVASDTDDVMMAPVVTQLDDDNCDGSINERDIPDIVFLTFTNGQYNGSTTWPARLRAISVIDGAIVEKWTKVVPGDNPGRSIAAGDIHPSPGNEIVVCTTGAENAVRAYDSSGNELWTSPDLGALCFMPSIADMDQDGQAEVIVRRAILHGDTGLVKHTLSPSNDNYVVVSDVTGNGKLDIVAPNKVFDATGTLIQSTTILGVHAAVGNLDKIGNPEIVAVNMATHTISIWRIDPNEPSGYKIIRQGLDINGTISPNPCCTINPNSAGCTKGGGTPTVADFNGDGTPDVGVAGGIGYVVFDGAKLMDNTVADVDTIMWLTETRDCSSAQTGSSVFDFDGDGKAEVVYADEVEFHIYDGTTGTELFKTCNTNGTLWEYPLVADVDSDGHADIIIGSNRYNSYVCPGTVSDETTGIRIFGDTEGKWVRTRRIWNQHAYHVTNVNEDGTIPAIELPNHLQPGLNNFRQNVQPLGEFAAPDLVVEVFPLCGAEYQIVARVRNLGQASVPAGVEVSFYAGDPASTGVKLGTMATTQVLYSLGSEDVVFTPTAKPDQDLYAIVDEAFIAASGAGGAGGSTASSGAGGGGGGSSANLVHPWHECRTDNNTSSGVNSDCGPN